jgi:MtN3 and saliva related transmembrane protein
MFDEFFNFDYNFAVYNHNVPLAINILVYIANIINLIYNLPQMYKTFKRKTTCDISGWFLSLRAISSVIWTIYSFYIDDAQLIVANIVTLIATIFIGYYKIRDMRIAWKINRQQKQISQQSTENTNLLESNVTISSLIDTLQNFYETHGNIPVIINESNDLRFNIRVNNDDVRICVLAQ